MRRVILPLLSLLLLTACGGFRAPQPLPPATKEVDGLSLTLEIMKTEPLELRATALNRGSRPALWKGSSSCPDPTRIVVVLPDGRQGQLHPIQPDGTAEPVGCRADIVQHQLGPGEQLQSHWRWNGMVIENSALGAREVVAPKAKLGIIGFFPSLQGDLLQVYIGLERPQ